MTARKAPRPGGWTLLELVIGVAVLGLIGGAAVAAFGALRERSTTAVLLSDLDVAVGMQQRTHMLRGSYASLADLRSGGLVLSPEVEVEAATVERDRFYLRVKHRKSERRCSVDFSSSSHRAINRKQCFQGDGDPAAESVRIADATAATPVDTVAATPEPPVETTSIPLVAAPLVDDPAGTSGESGETLSHVFHVTNRSEVPRTFTLELATSDAGIARVIAQPGPVRIDAGATAAVAVSYVLHEQAAADEPARVILTATDDADASLVGEGSFATAARLAVVAPEIIAPAPAEYRAGEAFVVEFLVRNRSNAGRVLVLAPVVEAGPITALSSSLSGPVPFRAGQSRNVRVTYVLAAAADGGTPATVGLRATDSELSTASAEGVHVARTALWLGPPTVGAPEDATHPPGERFTAQWTFTNNSNAARPFTITPTATGDLTIVGSTNTGSVTIARGATHTATVTYRVASTGVAGMQSAAGVSAVDAQYPAQSSASGSFTTTTGLLLMSPTVAPPTTTMGTMGQRHGVTYTVTNRTNAPRTFSFVGAASNASVIANVEAISDVTIPAFGTHSVPVFFTMAARAPGGATSDLTLSATDALATSYSGTGSTVITSATVVQTQSMRTPAGVSGNPASTGIVRYWVVNNSNVSRTYSLDATSGTHSVVGDPANPTNVAIPAFDSVQVAVSYTVANQVIAGTVATLGLTSTDVGAPARTATASAPFTTNLVEVAPTMGNAPAISGQSGTTGTSSFTLSNPTNAPRTFAFSLSAVNGGLISASVPASITVPAYGSASVSVPWTLTATPIATLTGSGSLVATNTTSAQSAAGSVSITRINRIPTVSSYSCSNTSPLSQTSVTCTAAGADIDGTIAAYHWAVYDAAAGGWQYFYNSGTSRAHTWNRPGVTYVAMYVVDNNGDASNGSWQYITLNVQNRAPTVASIDCSTTSPETLTAITCSMNASDPDGTIQTRTWRWFDPGTGAWTSATGAAARNFTFNGSGTAYVQAHVSDDYGLGSAWVSVPITVRNRPPTISSFSCSNTTPLSQTAVTCTAAGADLDGTIAVYNWAVYDAAAGGWQYFMNSGTSRSHTWSRPGIAYAAVYVVDNSGDPNAGYWQYITLNIQNRAPTIAAPSCSSTTPLSQTTVTCTVAPSDADGTISQVRWAVYDPAAGGWSYPTAGNSLSYTWSRPGSMQVAAYAIDDSGANSAGGDPWHRTTVTVQNRAPTLSAAVSPGSGSRQQTFTFTANASDVDGAVTSYTWYVVDPNGTWHHAGSSPTVSRTLNIPGSWVGYVTVSDDQGASTAQYTTYVSTYNQAPSVSLSANTTAITAGQSVYFTASGSDPDGDGLSTTVYTGDGGTIGGSGWRQYNSPGTYTAQASVTDSYGASAWSGQVTITVLSATCQDGGATNTGNPLPCDYSAGPEVSVVGAQEWEVGQNKSLGYAFRNNSAVGRNVCLRIRSDNNGVVSSVGGDGGDFCPWLGAGQAYNLQHSSQANGIGTSNTSAYVYYQDKSQYAASRSFANSVYRTIQPVQITGGPGPQAWFTNSPSQSFSYSVYNPNPVAVNYCVQVRSADLSVITPDSDTPGCYQSIGAYQTVQVWYTQGPGGTAREGITTTGTPVTSAGWMERGGGSGTPWMYRNDVRPVAVANRAPVLKISLASVEKISPYWSYAPYTSEQITYYPPGTETYAQMRFVWSSRESYDPDGDAVTISWQVMQNYWNLPSGGMDHTTSVPSGTSSAGGDAGGDYQVDAPVKWADWYGMWRQSIPWGWPQWHPGPYYNDDAMEVRVIVTATDSKGLSTSNTCFWSVSSMGGSYGSASATFKYCAGGNPTS